MLVSMHQPDYLPWLGYMNKIAVSDAFIFYDTAFYSLGGFHHRNKIKVNGGFAYLTIPLAHEECFKRLKDVALPSDTRWAKKHWKSLVNFYSRAPYFKEHAPFFEKFYNSVEKWKSLADLNIAVIEYLCQAFGLSAKLYRASQFDINLELRQTDAILDIIRHTEATEFLSGPSGKKYIEKEKFDAAGIKLIFQEFHEREHAQLFPPFLAGLSAVDLLFNEGPRAVDYLKNN